MSTDTNSESTSLPHRIASCPSLSGKSDITYSLVLNADSSLQFQLLANSGAGRFNDDAISYGAIRELLRHYQGKEIRSSNLKSLYPQKSVNSPGFMAAALLNEGLLQPTPNKEHSYEPLDDTAWIAKVRAELQSPTYANAKVSKPRKLLALKNESP